MDAVAAAAGTHKRELYREFASKKDLFTEAVGFAARSGSAGRSRGWIARRRRRCI
jgi:AcrR family transcriptional regulator